MFLTVSTSYHADKTIGERYVSIGIGKDLLERRDSAPVVQIKSSMAIVNQEVVVSILSRES